MLMLDVFYKDNQQLTRRPFQGDVLPKVRPITVLGTAETFVLELVDASNPAFTVASAVMDKDRALEIAQLLLNTVANFCEEDAPFDQIDIFPASQPVSGELSGCDNMASLPNLPLAKEVKRG